MKRPIEPITIEYLLKTRISRLLFAPLGREAALGVSSRGLISVDPRSVNPARTILHELIHVRRPFWSENKVILEERRLWKSSTWQEKAHLLKYLGRGQVWDGTEIDDDDLERPDAPSAEEIEKANTPNEPVD